MTQTYSQLQKQIDALQRQAEKLRETEVKGVVERIKVAIAEYNLTAAQLGLTAGATYTVRVGRRSTRAPKFADGTGNVWSGRGPRPHWLRDALKAGRKLEEFSTDGASAPASAPATAPRGKAKAKAAGSAKKRKTKTQYSDQAGNSWSGFGPKPRWLREALESGKSLEQFAA